MILPMAGQTRTISRNTGKLNEFWPKGLNSRIVLDWRGTAEEEKGRLA
jgi:hypothetical protein